MPLLLGHLQISPDHIKSMGDAQKLIGSLPARVTVVGDVQHYPEGVLEFLLVHAVRPMIAAGAEFERGHYLRHPKTPFPSHLLEGPPLGGPRVPLAIATAIESSDFEGLVRQLDQLKGSLAAYYVVAARNPDVHAILAKGISDPPTLRTTFPPTYDAAVQRLDALKGSHAALHFVDFLGSLDVETQSDVRKEFTRRMRAELSVSETSCPYQSEAGKPHQILASRAWPSTPDPELRSLDEPIVRWPVTAVLLSGGRGDYSAYVGMGSPPWVAKHGAKLSFSEAAGLFPGITTERYTW